MQETRKTQALRSAGRRQHPHQLCLRVGRGQRAVTGANVILRAMGEAEELRRVSEVTIESTRPGKTFVPSVDIFETEAAITVIADIPGVRPGDLDIDLRINSASPGSRATLIATPEQSFEEIGTSGIFGLEPQQCQKEKDQNTRSVVGFL